jgi:hypothetical protein
MSSSPAAAALVDPAVLARPGLLELFGLIPVEGVVGV